ncbi:hypothetical protein Lalb_Chr03g0043561 [Lupinus albus]|uniref:Uncharacterized protein n=1 Tax=Lupinus albus TaxID=3870 RepID=A0A6A4QYW5_LUPAL|nr:hypothetical protein Lalb_Chr03g0043561 [Lupinus albus]
MVLIRGAPWSTICLLLLIFRNRTKPNFLPYLFTLEGKYFTSPYHHGPQGS